MQTKNQCILLWTYSRYEELLDKEFLITLMDALLGFHGQAFDLDNFDLLLILQAATHFERSPSLRDNFDFMSKLAQLTQTADTFIVHHLDRLNMHEYTTCVIYYFTHPEVCSSTLKLSLLQKMGTCVPQFNEYQLQIFRRLRLQEKLRIEDKERGGAASNVSEGAINLLPTILEV